MGNFNSCIENGKEILDDIVEASEVEMKEDVKDLNILRDSIRFGQLPGHCHKYYNRDQCYLLRKENKVLHQCHEIDVQFPPTYCLKIDKQNVERYEKSKVPRWCSRIFYATPPHPMVEISAQSYNAVPHLFGSSNHRAVYGEFSINRFNSWFPIPNTCWKFYLRNFQIILYKNNINGGNDNNNNNNNIKQNKDKNENQLSGINEETEIEPATVFYEPKVNDYNAMYLTIHAPFLDDTLRTPLGKVIQETAEHVVLSFSSRVDFEKLFGDRDVRNMGNWCVNIVLRDENLLGDMDGIAACSVPLLYNEDSNKPSKRDVLLMNDEKDSDAIEVNVGDSSLDQAGNENDVPLNPVDRVVYYRFEVPMTADTAKRGRMEGQIAMRQKQM